MESSERPIQGGTAVFVGRASFRMVAGAADGAGDQSAGDAVAVAPPPVPGQVEERWFAPSEPVVLTPPPSALRGGDTDDGDEGSGAFGATLDGERRNAYRRSTQLWALAGALVVGATATLSAQAVMRRPAWSGAHSAAGRAVTTPANGATQAAGVTAGASSAIAMAPHLTGSTPATATAAIAPTVVPSTAISAGRTESLDVQETVTGDHGPDAKAAITAAPRPLPVAERLRLGRVPGGHVGLRSAVGMTALRPVAPGASEAWVDPFASDADPEVKAPATVSAKPVITKSKVKAPARPTFPKWVDPFVD